MIEFFRDLDLWLKIIPIVISLIALIVSIVVAWKNRKTLQVEISDLISSCNVFLIDSNGDPLPYRDCVIATIEIVNPSPMDIAFFDLRAFYPNNLNVEFLTRRAILYKNRDNPVMQIDNFNGQGDRVRELIIPSTNYGILKSNSFTRFHIVMFPDPDAESLLLSFKVAMKARIKDQFAVTGRKKFRFFGKRYNISCWNKQLQQSQQSEP
ncbi:hypothetical protein [Oceanobacillus caeni]|uniref:Uncharacterized protein n=1 Tax=Oceanobacillus caeni TaxID=405946 RepID=A0ABR5MKP7_9BACI|nr:hypothetical protein [Oceanobacillus caeni]KPH76098.1 hypothetical protein AFL42_07325 [Oceanobacillus caeni]